MARTTIRSDDITDGQVAIADLSATGTASSSTALYGDNTWKTVVTSPVGGGTEKIFYENEQSVDVDYTVTANNNAMSAGIVTGASGVTVTLSGSSVWTIV